VYREMYYIETYGCQMNDHDSEKMAAILEGLGMTPAPSASDADIVIINTCSIREKAEHKVYTALGRLKPLKIQNPSLVTVVAGCVAQQEKENLLKRSAHLDIVLGTHSITRLPELIRETRQKRQRIASTEFLADVGSLHMHAPLKGKSPVRSYVSVMQGCSNFCSYCVVPFTRGPELSRSQEEIVQEIRGLVSQGVKEVTLLGQNVNAYGLDLSPQRSFPALLKQLDGIPGLLRIRFTTSHPKDFDERMASAMADLESVCPHIHLPLQSGSNRILKAMNRGYTYEHYLDKIRMLREKIPGVAITTDLIVGFPGETDPDFSQTAAVLEEIRYDQIFSFKYSPRPGTAAKQLPDQIADEVKAERLARLHAIQDAVTAEYHRAAEGTVEEVLIEGFKPGSGQPFGRTGTNKIVNLEPADTIREGDRVRVLIVRGLKHSLLGKRIG
jgi:tRNA-2-methylthio-N6-dimethylallyladenosine synthase